MSTRRGMGASPGCERQRGVVLLLALLAVAAMALSGMALVRVTDATTAITGSVAFRHSAAAAPDTAVEEAVAALFESRSIADPSVDAAALGYSARRVGGEDARGIPAVLAKLSRYPPEYPVRDVGNGVKVRHVIERMCRSSGPATADNCTLVPATDSVLTISEGASIEPPRVPLYRQTIRVDGPAGASLFVQAWLGDISGRRRLSWRVIAE